MKLRGSTNTARGKMVAIALKASLASDIARREPGSEDSTLIEHGFKPTTTPTAKASLKSSSGISFWTRNNFGSGNHCQELPVARAMVSLTQRNASHRARRAEVPEIEGYRSKPDQAGDSLPAVVGEGVDI